MVDAKDVKELRNITGIGMLDCKNALKEARGDIKKAVEIMRKKGFINAAKKSGRTTTEGLIITKISHDKEKAFMVEINCETDFVSRSKNFQEFCDKVAEYGLQNPQSFKENIEEDRIEVIAKLGENVQIGKSRFMSCSGVIGEYRHNGRIGVLLCLNKKDENLAKEIAMHIAAANPLAINSSKIPSEILEKEREIYTFQTKDNGKPEEVTKKIVDGKIRKFLESTCLLDQNFIKDPSKKVREIIKDPSLEIIDFERFEIQK